MKKIMVFILTAVICISCFASVSQSASAYGWGWISSKVKWTLYDNGLLNFSGNGIAYFGYYGFQSGYYEQVKNIVLSEGITGIHFDGENMPNLKSITLSSTCTEVKGAPYNSLKLEKYVVPSGNTAFKATDGVLFGRNKEENGTYKSTYTLVHYPTAKTTEKYTMQSNVTAVADHAFRNNSHLKQLVFADSVTDIGNASFENCTALIKAEFPLSLETMGYNAFKGCTELKTVALFGRINRLDSGTFQGCSALTTISFPSTLEHINSGCFENCYSLENIDLQNIKSIGIDALFNCHSLETLEISAKLAYHSDYGDDSSALYDAFLGNNYKLESISVDDGNPYYCSVDGVLYSKDKTILYSYPAGKTDKQYTTLDTTEVIHDRAFSGAKNLETLNLYGHRFWRYVFDGCDSLTKLVIKDNAISTSAEFNLPNLEVLELPDYLTGIIQLDVFSLCPKLPSDLVLPSGVNNVSFMDYHDSCPIDTVYIFKSKEIFENGETIDHMVSKLVNSKEILAGKGVELIRLDESGSCGENAVFTLDKNGRLVIEGTGTIDNFSWGEYPQFIKEVVVSEGISGIGANAFADCAVKTLVLPSTLTEIQEAAFEGCNGLNTVIDYTDIVNVAEGNTALDVAQHVYMEKGDVNFDGAVNSLDAAQVLKHDAQLITIDSEGLYEADINGDGTVNSLDAAIILKIDANLMQTL